MSCVDNLVSKGYLAYSFRVKGGLGQHNVTTIETPLCAILVVKHLPADARRLKLKIHVKAHPLYGSPVAQYNCAVGFRIGRIVIYSLDVQAMMSKMMDTLMNIVMLQNVMSMMGALT